MCNIFRIINKDNIHNLSRTLVEQLEFYPSYNHPAFYWG